MSKAYLQFISACPTKVARGVKLSRFCTMKVGGLADLLVEAKTKAELIEVLRLAHKLGIKYFVLAGGSNTVFSDKGFKGLVVRYTANKLVIPSDVKRSRACLTAGRESQDPSTASRKDSGRDDRYENN